MNKKTLFLVLLISLFIFPSFVFAKEISEMVKAVETAATAIGGSVVVIGWIIAGILWLTSMGNPGKLAIAKTAIFACAVGTVLIIAAKGGLEIIKGLLPGLFN